MERKHNNSLVCSARALRKNMTKEERHLWFDFLRTYPIKFSRQKVLGRYIVDFYCAKANLIIELDGSQHYEEKGIEKDMERTKYLEGYGLSVIRIPNNEVNENFRGVCEYIDITVKQSLSLPCGHPATNGGGPPLSASPTFPPHCGGIGPLHKGAGCPHKIII